MSVEMKGFKLLARAALGMVLCAAFGAMAAPLRGPEAWLEFMGGNVRKDGLRLDLEAIRDGGISGVQFFHINRDGAWPECPEQIPCLSEKWEDVVRFLGEECERLGLALTVQNCPGWSQSGGPWVDLDHCQRDIKMSRSDFTGGAPYRLPDIPEKFRDADSDWRDVCVLAFPTPAGDAPDAFLKPAKVEKEGETRIFRFGRPVTVRSLVLPGVDCWNRAYGYEMPWMRVALDVHTPQGWREVVRSPLPVSNWRDSVETFTLACGEAEGSVWRFRFEHDLPIKKYCEPRLSSAPRTTDWESKSARTLRSLPKEGPPPQSKGCFIDPASIVDITGNAEWKVPDGRWTVIRLGHVNAKRVNAPAPKEATGWECDKLDPSGIEACFAGYIGKLNAGVLKGKMSAMLVDSWECFGQTWTPKMEAYFQSANGYALRQWLPALFGWIVGSPAETERFLTDWRRTNGDLITKNYYGHMAELAHEAGLEAYYETAFGDIIHGDLLEYWKYSDAPMCEFWYPHASRLAGGCGWYSYKPIRPCASAAHIYGKRRVVAEAFTGAGIHWDEDFRKLQDDANRHFARGVTHLAFQSYTHAPAPDALPPGGCMGGFNGTPFTRLQTWWKHMPEFSAWLTRCEELLEAGLPAQDVLWYLGDAVDHKPDEEYPFPEGFRADYLNHDVLTNRLSVKDGLFEIPEGTTWKILWVPDERFMLPATRAALDRLAASGGKVVFGGKDALVKALAGCEKDVATIPALGDGSSEDFMWIHRKVDGGDRYFVAAGTNGWRGKVTFRASGAVSVFDPVSLERTVWRNGDVLEIPPSRSVFVEFGGDASRAANTAAGESRPASLSNSSTFQPFTLSELTGWTLSFPAGWGAPPSVKLERSVSWTEIPGFTREAKAFSGTVTYEADFACENAAGAFELDLGRVESMAKVFVNGKPVRTLWCEPFRCDITKFVRKGHNRLRIEVTNTWRNRVIYDLGLPEKERKTWILYQPKFNPGPNDPFVPSGIIGPVLLRSCGVSSSNGAVDRVRLAEGWRTTTTERAGRQFTFDNMEACLDGRMSPQPHAYTAPDFNDSAWKTVRVPHDRGLDRGFACDRLTQDGVTDPQRVGWYRRSLAIPASAEGKRVFFECDGAMSFSMVWINGHFVGGWPYGYSPWRVELTPHVNFGGTNVLAVRTAHVPESARFYVGGGLQRDCWLAICDDDHLVPDSVAIRTEVKGKDAEVSVTYEMSRSGKKQKRFEIKDVQLWDVESPKMYAVEIEGETFRYGVRTFGFYPDERGFQLNGRRVPIRGVCLHQDFDVLGNAWNESACRRRLLKLKEVGCNAIRMSHYRHPAGFYDLCDEMGFLVMDEAFDQWNAAFNENDYHRLFPRWHSRDLRAMVRANRNHPSIVLWGIGNEIAEQRLDLGGYDIKLFERTGKRLLEIVREEDPTRPVTTANNNAQASLMDEVDFVDVYGFNYCCGQIAPYHAHRPTKPMITTETGCYLATRGEYYFDLKYPRDCRDLRVSSYMEGALRKMEEEWAAHDATPAHVGGFYWTGFDYLGGPGASPWMRAKAASVDPARQAEMKREIAEFGQVRGAIRACPTGLFDLAGFPRDVYWQFKARWCHDEPMVHLLPHWNWPERVGKRTPVVAFTTGDEVELFVNGESQGRRKVPFAGARVVWPDVVYAPGAIRAVAYRNGGRWAETAVETTGDVAKLVLRQEPGDVVADGESVVYVNLDAVDSCGRVVPRTRLKVDVSVAGGELVGVENGDETDLTGFRNREHVVFNGHLSIVVRPGIAAKEPLAIDVSAKGTSVPAAHLAISR